MNLNYDRGNPQEGVKTQTEFWPHLFMTPLGLRFICLMLNAEIFSDFLMVKKMSFKICVKSVLECEMNKFSIPIVPFVPCLLSQISDEKQSRPIFL